MEYRAQDWITYLAITAIAALGLLATGCETSQDASTESATAESASDEPDPGSDEHASDEQDHAKDDEDGHHDVHLGNKMYELQRRWSAIWFAGEAGDAEMVKYQTHEIEEIVESMEDSDPQEAGVDVVDRVNLHVVDHLEGIEEAAAANDQALFEERYKAVITGCNSCHAETKHGFIRVKMPEYNPYPNLKFGE